MSRRNRMIIAGAGSLLLLIVLGLLRWIFAPTPRFKATTPDQTVCILAGEIRDPRKTTSGFGNLGGYVRLHFEASTLEECQTVVSGYCRGKLHEGLAPINLNMTFRMKSKAPLSDRFHVTSHCLFEQTEGNEP